MHEQEIKVLLKFHCKVTKYRLFGIISYYFVYVKLDLVFSIIYFIFC
jgi:hypothetical protein